MELSKEYKAARKLAVLELSRVENVFVVSCALLATSCLAQLAIVKARCSVL